MASMDEYKIKITTEGIQGLDQASAKMGEMNENVKKINSTLNGFNIRNVAFQLQDIAVQAEMGTNAFRIFTQQAPQLLSAFGTTGAIIGAVAAIIGSVAQPVLKSFGVDLRSLKELSDDLTTAMERMKASQIENLPTVEGLRVKYGELAEAVKNYSDASEKADKKLAFESLKAQVEEFRKKYLIMGDDVETASKKAADAAQFDMGASLSNVGIQLAYLKLTSGLTSEQLTILGKNLKDLPKDANAEKILEVFTKVKKELTETGISPSQIKDFEDLYKKIQASAESVKKLNENLNEAADTASKFNSAILSVQLEYIGKIGAAQRANNQYSVADLTTKQRLAELDKERQKLQEAGKLTDFARQELTLKENLAKAQGLEKEKDFAKSQSETFKTAKLSNEARERQLSLDAKIIGLQDSIRVGTATQLQYEIDIATNAKTYQDTVANINEQRRKNLITEDAAKQLRKEAADIQNQADENAQKALDKRKNDMRIQLDLMRDSLLYSSLERRSAFETEQRTLGRYPMEIAFEKQLDAIRSKSASEQMRINDDANLSLDERKRKTDIVVNDAREQLKLAKEQYEFNKKVQESFGAGVQSRMKELIESFSNFKVAGMMVDSVWSNMSSSLDKFVETGKLSFGDLAHSIIIDLEKIALKSAVIGVFKSMGLADMFSMKAVGGPVAGNTPYIIGEQGPELFIPNGAGTIIPNNRLTSGGLPVGGGVTNVYHINAIDAKSVAQLFAENRMTLFGSVEQARRELPMRTR